jgi:hypothetical protein
MSSVFVLKTHSGQFKKEKAWRFSTSQGLTDIFVPVRKKNKIKFQENLKSKCKDEVKKQTMNST